MLPIDITTSFIIDWKILTFIQVQTYIKTGIGDIYEWDLEVDTKREPDTDKRWLFTHSDIVVRFTERVHPVPVLHVIVIPVIPVICNTRKLP